MATIGSSFLIGGIRPTDGSAWGGGLVSLGIFSSKGGGLLVDSPLSGLKDRQR